MSIFGAKIESSSDNQTELSPAGGLIQTSQGAAVDTSNPIKIQHNRVVLDADDPFETNSDGKLVAKLESPVALYNGKIAVYYNTPLHNENDHLAILYNWPIEIGNDGKFYIKYHYPLNVDGHGFLNVGLNADSLQERNHNLEPVPTTYSYVGGTVIRNAQMSVLDIKTNGLTVNIKSDTEIEYTFLKKGIYELTGLHDNAIVFGFATSATPNVCETLLASYAYFLDVKDISKPVTLTLHNGVGSGFLVINLQIIIVMSRSSLKKGYSVTSLLVTCSRIMTFFCGFPACMAAIIIYSLSRNTLAIPVLLLTPFLFISACISFNMLCHCSNDLLKRNDPSISTPSNITPSNDNRSHNQRQNTSLSTQGQRIQPQQQLQAQSWPQVQSLNVPPPYPGLMTPPIYSAHNYGFSDPAYSSNNGISSMITTEAPPSYESVACRSGSHQVAARNQSPKYIDTKL